MALTITDAGNAVNDTTVTSLTTGATITASAGDWLIAIIGASNSGTAGASTVNTPTDSGSNSWSQRALINFSPGSSAQDGATLAIYTSLITNALSGGTVTANFSANTHDSTLQVYRVQPGSGEAVEFVAADTTGSTGNTTTHSAVTVSVTNGDTIFGAAAIETDDAITSDSDTTNGNWSTVITRLVDGFADNDSMSNVSQYKTVNATGNQSWACTTASARDSARTYLILRAVAAKIIAADPGSYALTGQAASLEYGREVAANTGSYAFTGTVANLERGREVVGNNGTYALTGSDAGLILVTEKKIVADPGAYAFTGQPASLEVGHLLVAQGSSYAFTGQPASLERGREVLALSGSYALTGVAAQLLRTRRVTALAGAYALTGTAASLERERSIDAASGLYLLTGESVTFAVTGPVSFTFGVQGAANMSPGVSMGAGMSRSISTGANLRPSASLDANMSGSVRTGARNTPALER